LKKEKAELNINHWNPATDKDVFGFDKMDNKLIHLKVAFDKVSHSLLIRDFPSFERIKPYRRKPQIILEFDVVKIYTFARFFCGLMNRITIIGNNDAKELLYDYFNKNVLLGFENNFSAFTK
jgi:hypothetical protein